MRSRLTWLVVAAVAGLVLAAIVDVVAEGEPDADGETETTSTLPTATVREVESPTAAALREANVSGTLFATFRSGAGCEYRATALPSLELVGSGYLQRCRLAVSPNGEYVAEVARCPDNRASLLRNIHSDVADVFRGCSAAWKPRGTFTYVRQGRVVTASLACVGIAGCGRVLIPRAELAAGIHQSFRRRYGVARVSHIIWVTTSRLAVVVQTRRNMEAIVLFDARQEIRPVVGADFGVFPLHSHLEVVRKQKATFVGGRGYGGFAVFDFSGGFLGVSPARAVAATAHSPDGRWVALARPGSVCISPSDDWRSSITCIRGDAQDLAWR